MKDKQELKLIAQNNLKPNKEERENINCIFCKGIDVYKENDYMVALEKLYKEENKDE